MSARRIPAAASLVVVLSFLTAVTTASAAGKKKVWPPSTPVAGAKLKPNEWVAIERHGAGRRSSGAVVYLPGEKSWVLMMGSVGAWNDRGPFCYDEQTFNLKDRLWKNRFPPGKPRKPAVGPIHGRRTLLTWSGPYTPKAYYQYALDADRGVVVVFARRATLEYDLAKRVWRDLKPRGHPTAGSHWQLKWGSLCYDAVNKEFLLFGGNNGGSEFNDTRTWIYSPAGNEWRRLKSESKLIAGLRGKAEALRTGGQRLYGACANRYFRTELPSESKVRLSEMAKKLGAGIDALAKELEGSGAGHEKTQCGWAATDLKSARALLARIGDAPSAEALKAGLAMKRALRHVEHSLLGEPPPRAHSPMVYDPATRKIVLFGGDRLDMLYADTWVYDCATRKWQERRPEFSPSPRAGHAFLHLPESKKLALVGGYRFDSQTGYQGAMYKQLPMQAWTYDVPGNKWHFVKQWPLPERRKKVPGAAPRYVGNKGGGFTLAVGEGDVLLFAGGTTYACKLDVSKPQSPSEANGRNAGAGAVKPGTVEWRVGPYDPDWYLAGVAPSESAFQAKLKAVPANTWTVVTGKGVRLPRQNRDYGTAVYDPDREAILWWSGGHSCHCGSDIPIFSMKTGRYHQKYAPAFPLDGTNKSGGQFSNGTFLGQPWLPAHTYHAYAYDPVSKKMICCGGSICFVFDPDDGTWIRKGLPSGKDPRRGMNRDNTLTLTLCSTPTGPYAWTRYATLFMYDGKKEVWSEVAVGGEKLAGTRCMASGMCYDSKRNRLIMTHSGFKGGLMAVDLKTMTARRLKPKGMARATGHFLREVVYDASRDVVVVATKGKRGVKGPPTWPVYDCAKNAWVGVKVGGPNPTSVSLGLMYDPKRKLVVGVDANSRVYVMKLDMTRGKVLE
jgi:Galactose oxidase, central domain